MDQNRFAAGPNVFFSRRSHKEEWEWVILSYLTNILLSIGRGAPLYAEKLNQSDADFQSYLTPEKTFRKIEVTEVFRSDYRRTEHYRETAKGDCNRSAILPSPHPQPWLSFAHVLREKLAKSYGAGSWLLIYHNMTPPEFNGWESIPWHDLVLNELRTWTKDSPTTCDITKSCYESIYVVDCEGKAAVRLHPHWDIVKAARFP